MLERRRYRAIAWLFAVSVGLAFLAVGAVWSDGWCYQACASSCYVSWDRCRVGCGTPTQDPAWTACANACDAGAVSCTNGCNGLPQCTSSGGNGPEPSPAFKRLMVIGEPQT